jgi:hypothetical protein
MNDDLPEDWEELDYAGNWRLWLAIRRREMAEQARVRAYRDANRRHPLPLSGEGGQ